MTRYFIAIQSPDALPLLSFIMLVFFRIKKFTLASLLLLCLNCNINLMVSCSEVRADTNYAGTLTDGELAKRRLVETNGIAAMLCKFVSLLKTDIAKIVIAFMIFSMGIGTYLGKLTFGMLVSFCLGLMIFFAAESVFVLMAPYSDISEGCDCKQKLAMGPDSAGGHTLIDTKLNKDCTVKP